MAQPVRSRPFGVHDPPSGRGEAAELIKVRGTRDGLVLGVPVDTGAVPPREAAAALAAHLDGAEAFFQGAEIIIDLGEREFGEEELSLYRHVLEERDVVVRGFAATSLEGRAILRRQGFHPLQLVEPARAAGGTTGALAAGAGAPAAPAPAGQEATEALYLRRTLRSGVRVRHHGSLLIVGDINAGAEVAASGDIIVWGHVRGMVHAGALGDDGAIICALGLNPTQLRIGPHYALPPAEKGARAGGGPERVRLEGGRLVVEPWKTK